MAQTVAVGGQKALSQTKEALLKSYQKRLKDDVKSMVDNYVEIIKLGKVYSCILFGRLVSRSCTRHKRVLGIAIP